MSTFNERTSSGVSINGYIIKESLILFGDALIVINLLRSVLEMSTNLFCGTRMTDLVFILGTESGRSWSERSIT